MTLPSRFAIAVRSGIARVAAATVFAGVVGYVISWLVPRVIGFGPYASFASYWALSFLLAAALSGAQQEIARTTRPASSTDGRQGGGVWVFTVASALVVAAVVAASSPVWVRAISDSDPWSLVAPLSVGAGSYVVVAVATGTFYGLLRWNEIFWIIVCEAALRLTAILIALAVDGGLAALAWAVSLPFAATWVVFLIVRRSILLEDARIGVSMPQLVRNVSGTVLAASSTGLLISGFPFVLTLLSTTESPEDVGLVVVTSTLVRAPLIVTAMALQSYLVVRFRDIADVWRPFLRSEAVVLAAGLGLAVMAYPVGPWVFSALFPAESPPTGVFVLGLVVSSALVAALCLSGSVVLARGAHATLTAGWVVAAVATIGLLLLPLDLASRTVLALTLAPVLGLVVHVAGLVRATRGDRTAPTGAVQDGGVSDRSDQVPNGVEPTLAGEPGIPSAEQ